MSIVVTDVCPDKIYVVADTGFSDGSRKWSLPNTPKFIVHRDFLDRDIIIAVTGSASQMSVMAALLADFDAKEIKIEGTLLGMFEFVKKLNIFCKDIDYPTGPDADNTFSEYHIIIDDTAWAIQGYYIVPIDTWECMGSGDNYARGAMTVMGGGGKEMAQDAVRAAIAHDMYCHPPLVIVEYDRFTRRCSDMTINHDCRV